MARSSSANSPIISPPCSDIFEVREGSTRSGKPLISDLGSGPVELKHAYERLKAFLLRNGYAYEGKASWNESDMKYLRKLTMPCSSKKSIILLLPLRPLSPITDHHCFVGLGEYENLP